MANSNYEVSKQLYRVALKEDAPLARKVEAEADLEDFIRLFPNDKQAKEIRNLFG